MKNSGSCNIRSMTASEMIRDRFATLSPGLQRAGKYALEHPNEIVTASMRSIAQRAEVPPATLVRFAQTLGFPGWPQLKEAFAHELGLATEQFGHGPQGLGDQAGPQGDVAVLAQLFDAHAHNLAFTRNHNSDVLPRAAATLVGAPQVHVAGFRACFALAFQLVYAYRQFRPTVHLLDAQAGALEMRMRAMAAGDAVVVAGFAPYSREADLVARTAHERRCKVVALTDSPASPLSLLADETLLFAVRGTSAAPSIAAGMALVEVLLELVVALSGEAVADQIRAAEDELFASGTYLRRPGR
ncbi:MAG: DNA-binding protein [Rhodoferax sp.]|nr:DNA-binding protein [Rhodoferax sp.]